jgi:hypothetical protein
MQYYTTPALRIVAFTLEGLLVDSRGSIRIALISQYPGARLFPMIFNVFSPDMCFPCFLVYLLLCFTALVFRSLSVFKILDYQAGMSSPTNAGQSCAVSSPLFCSYMLSGVFIILDSGYRNERSPCLSTSLILPIRAPIGPGLYPYGGQSTIFIYAQRDRRYVYDDIQRHKLKYQLPTPAVW